MLLLLLLLLPPLLLVILLLLLLPLLLLLASRSFAGILLARPLPKNDAMLRCTMCGWHFRVAFLSAAVSAAPFVATGMASQAKETPTWSLHCGGVYTIPQCGFSIVWCRYSAGFPSGKPEPDEGAGCKRPANVHAESADFL